MLYFCSGRPPKVGILWINLFRIYSKSRQSITEKGNAENFYTPNFTCCKNITTLTGNFELIIILLHSNKTVFTRGTNEHRI